MAKFKMEIETSSDPAPQYRAPQRKALWIAVIFLAAALIRLVTAMVRVYGIVR